MAEQPPVLESVNHFRAALLREERAAAMRLVRAYGSAYQKLQGDIAALEATIAALPEPTWGQVERLSIYRQLQAQIAEQINRYGVIAENEVQQGTLDSIARALADSEQMVQMSLPGLPAATVRGLLVHLNPDAVLTMMGFLESDSPLYTNLRTLGDSVADLVADKLREGIILGYNPRKVARLIRQATGQGLSWSLNTARTANLWAYRLASHANYQANPHVIKGWVWYAELGDVRTCLSCISQHGSEHTLDEVLNDHHAGRCSPIPRTFTYAELGFNVPEEPATYQRGEEYFRGLSAQEQRDRMGHAMYSAWKSGAISFSDLSQSYTDPVYGEMLREASLKGILGERATQFYKR